MAKKDRLLRVCDMVPVAKRRLPPFVHAYMACGTGEQYAVSRNEERLSQITLTPKLMRGRVVPDTSVTFMGQNFAYPFGISPIGLQSLIWPGSEVALAQAAQLAGIPYALSTVAGASIEQVTAVNDSTSWFQLYAPNDRNIMSDLLSRARKAGMKTLIVTADVPGPSRREEMQYAGAPIGSRNSMAITPRVFWQSMLHPIWALSVLAHGGKFRFRNLEPYADASALRNISAFIGSQLNGSLTWDYLDDIRKEWKGPMLVKGLLNLQDVERAIKAGVDGLIISNHGGRQIDAVPASIDMLQQIRAAVGNDFPLALDSGIRSGLDVARALACGADFVMSGRSFLFGMAAMGRPGAEHVINIFQEELENTMMQLGARNIAELRDMR